MSHTISLQLSDTEEDLIKDPAVIVPGNGIDDAEDEDDDLVIPVDGEDDDKKKDKGGPEKYYESVGRRKEATARIRLFTKKSIDAQDDPNKALVIVNGKPYAEFFKTIRLQNIVESPLKKLKSINRFKATVLVHGGGSAGQADAIKFGLSRALVLFDINFAKKLRRSGFLTRDARVKERRKYGLKKARKSPQWSKR